MADYPPLLTPAEERALLAELVNCRAEGRQPRYLELRERLALANLRMVRAMASRYARDEVDLEDLVQIGFLGLLKAIDRYDPARANGGRFATVAGWWILSALSHSLRGKRESPAGMLHWIPATDGPRAAAARVDVETLLALATPRQRQVLTLYFGLGGESPALMVEVAEKLSISHQGVSGILKDALARIRRRVK